MDNLALKAGLGYSSLKIGDADASTAIYLTDLEQSIMQCLKFL